MENLIPPTIHLLDLRGEVIKEINRYLQSIELPKQPSTRAEEMVEKYGEAITKDLAGKLLNVSSTTVWRLIRDGKIKTCMCGQRIDTRSLAEYLNKP